MTQGELYMYGELARTHCTNGIRDRITQALMIRSARTRNDREVIMHLIVEARLQWLNWLAVTQRKWQSNCSRRPQRNRHHDSWDIREKYVRC